jgi:hypothetical protein
MSALADVKAFLLRHGAAPAVDEAAAECAARPDADRHLALVQARERLTFEIYGFRPTIANGLAAGFVALVRERLARGA